LTAIAPFRWAPSANFWAKDCPIVETGTNADEETGVCFAHPTTKILRKQMSVMKTTEAN
jgi:hypothetical protein